MKFRRFAMSLGFISVGLIITNCGSDSTTATTGDAKTIVTNISTAIRVAGNGFKTSSRSAATRPTSTDCTDKGYPNVSQSNGNYPGHLTYCFMTVDSGDTVYGGFSTPKTMSCIISNAGITFTGTAQTITVTQALIDACSLSTSDLPVGTQFTATGSSPASFNTKYNNGVILDLSSKLGLTFKVAFNVSGTKSSFLTNESWTDGHIGSTGGTLDTSTGDLWYEARVERENCSTSSSCGWNRHTRIHALLTMNGTEPSALKSLTFAYSNTQFTPGQNSLGGTFITAKGDLTDGIKSRLWAATNGSGGSPTSTSHYDTVGNWVETTNSKCYTSSSESATTCGTGLDKFSTTTKFLLHSTDGHMSVSNWLSNITGQTFSNVDPDSDTQF